VSVPVKRLLSDASVERLAGDVKRAINRKTPLELDVPKHHDEGTNNISCVDGDGNMVAITFTQGSSFGAQVTIAGLGLTLGHGMSRFNPQAGHPNSPGGGKRPLHNMCPSIVSRSGRAVLAIGGAGGMKIPTALFDALREFICRTGSLEQAIGAPRLHSTGTLDVLVEKNWPAEEVGYLQEIGFKPRVAENPARVSAVSFEPKTGECRAQMR